jgi:predicted amidophosphoribosyltransferase
MTTNTIISVADYYGTKGASELVHRVKNNDVAAIEIMARAMAVVAMEYLPVDSVLIPVPSHTGHATNTLRLAEQISQLTGLQVLDIVKGKKREPWYALKQQNNLEKVITYEFFGFYLTDYTNDNEPVIVDTVRDTGCTINTIIKLFDKRPTTLIYAAVQKQNYAG